MNPFFNNSPSLKNMGGFGKAMLLMSGLGQGGSARLQNNMAMLAQADQAQREEAGRIAMAQATRSLTGGAPGVMADIRGAPNPFGFRIGPQQAAMMAQAPGNNPMAQAANRLAATPGTASLGLEMAIEAAKPRDPWSAYKSVGNSLVEMTPTGPRVAYQNSASELPKKGSIREFQSGDQRVTEEFDGTTWVRKASGPQWSPEKGKPRTMYDENNVPVQVEADDPRLMDGTLSPKPFRTLPTKAADQLATMGGNLDTYERLTSTFKPEYVGRPLVGGAAIQASKIGIGDPAMGDWWADYQSMVNAVRNEMFGAALTDTERAEFEKAMITPGMTPELAQRNLQRQVALLNTGSSRLANSLKNQGYAPGAIEAQLGRRISDLPDPMARPGVGASSAQASGISNPRTQQEFDALPTGALYIDPDDGMTYRKP